MEIAVSLILIIVGIGVLISIHLCINRASSRRGISNNNNNNNPAFENLGLGSTSMSRGEIDKLPCFNYEEREKGSSPLDCAVCLENFTVGDKCRSLPLCDHSFHAECVDSWLLRVSLCPICRTSADSWRRSSISGLESERFSGAVVNIEDEESPRVEIELGDVQTGEIGTHLDGGTEIEHRDNQNALNTRNSSSSHADSPLES